MRTATPETDAPRSQLPLSKETCDFYLDHSSQAGLDVVVGLALQASIAHEFEEHIVKLERERNELRAALEAERKAREKSDFKAQVAFDMHAALGIQWGDNPYMRIDELKAAEAALETTQTTMLRLKRETDEMSLRTITAETALEAERKARKDWYSHIALENRFSADIDGGISQDKDGPWILRSYVDAAIEARVRELEKK